MKVTLRILISAVFLLLCATSLAAKSWHGITPLKSTRDDVARILKRSIAPDALRFEYNSDVELVEFLFAQPDALSCMEALAPGTVLTIDITPKTQMYLSDLQLDEKKLLRLESSPEFIIDGDAYFDDVDGLVVTIQKTIVQRVVYISAKNDRHLCWTQYHEPRRFAKLFICGLCPTVVVSCQDEVEDGGLASFTANVPMGTPAPPLTFTWTVTGGKIVERQGTDSIKVDSKGLQAKSITATIEVGGVDPSCNRSASCTTAIIRKK
jgi:hypothetical protein